MKRKKTDAKNNRKLKELNKAHDLKRNDTDQVVGGYRWNKVPYNSLVGNIYRPNGGAFARVH